MCTCICKSWHSLIKNPSFISTHLTLTISSGHHLLLFRFCSEKSYSFDCSIFSEHYSLCLDNNQQLATYMLLDFPPFKTKNPCFHVIGSFNGIICLANNIFSYNYSFILWNLLIKKSLILPKPNVTYNTHGPYKASLGFGFNFKTNDYKVLRIVFVQERFIEVELYSLNTNSWKSLTCVAPSYEFNGHDRLALVNGVLHWVAFNRMGGNGMFRNVVLVFDMGDEVFREIKLPESLTDVIRMYMSVRKYGDSTIAVIESDFFAAVLQCHMWVMTEYGVVGSWTKLFCLGKQGGGFPKVLGFRKSGDVLLKMHSRQIVSCDPHNQGIKDIGEQGVYSFVDDYVESLVLIDNTNSVPDAIAAAKDANDFIEDEHDDTVSAIDGADETDVIYNSNDDKMDAADALLG